MLRTPPRPPERQHGLPSLRRNSIPSNNIVFIPYLSVDTEFLSTSWPL